MQKSLINQQKLYFDLLLRIWEPSIACACWVLQNCAALVDFMAKHTIKQSGKTQCHIKLKRNLTLMSTFQIEMVSY